jgi:4-amino-4-deoxy-L-arabinose transferase-like glycosyltransferase
MKNRSAFHFSQRQFVLIILLFSLLIRLFVGIKSNNNQVWIDYSDDLAREEYAKTILSKGFIHEISDFKFKSAESIFAPVVPIVLAIKTIIFGENWVPIYILNSILGAFSCLLIYLIASKYFSQKVSVFAFLWAAFYPSFIRYIGTAGNEPWLVFLFALTFLFAIKTIEAKKANRYVILLSLSLTLLFHTDERYLAYPLLFALFLFVGESPVWLKLKKILFLVSLTVLFSIPWLIRNYLVYDDFVLVSCRTTSITKSFINHRPEVLFFDHEPNSTYLSQAQIDSIKNGTLTIFSNGNPIEDREIKAIKRGNEPHRFRPMEKIISRFSFLWMPLKLNDSYRINGYNFMPAWSLRHNLLTGLSYGLLLPFALIAFYVLIKKRNWEVVCLFAGILIYHTFIHIAFIPYTRDRYRHPVDFIIIILGCYGLSLLYEFLWLKINSGSKNFNAE